jgi:3-phenylpropionate/trans-cinnamate dioxygenase ferredoxin reductase component
MRSEQTFVIVGASLAGATAAEALREEGFDGRVLLVGAEPERPYERPPLSKDYVRGESEREKTYVHPESFYAEREIDLRTGTVAEAIDPTAHEVGLAGGERVRYDRLLIATGAEPRRLKIAGAELDGVHYLRTLEDSDALRARLDVGGRAVVVGAGWIGAEVAASARERGLEVTVIEPASVPLERVLGPEVGAIYRDIHREHGVELLLGTGVEALEGDGDVVRVRTSDGRALDCDFVVVGVGVKPRTELAEAAGLAVDNGILVDANLRTSAPDIFAAGDVANAQHPFYGQRIRVEHWANAKHQGPAAARNMLGKDASYDRIPYFFSDQYDTGMEYAGYATSWDQVVFRGDPASREFIAFWLQAGRVVAGMNFNVWEVNDHIQALIRSHAVIDPARLTDPEVPLDELPGAGAQRRGDGAPPRPPEGFLAQGVNYAKRFVRDRLTKPPATPVSALAAGEAKVISVDGDKVAAYRDEQGELHAVSAVCTHMGCLVDWNAAAQIWDCPCHGSRFDHDGHVIEGPAKRDLELKQLDASPTKAQR